MNFEIEIGLRKVRFRYKSEDVLAGVDATIPASAVTGIIGPNGSGKTTLLKCIDRLLVPQSGSISLDGRALATLDRDTVARTIGYVPQATPGSFPATVFDTVLLGRKPHIRWGPTKKDDDYVASIIEQLGLAELAMEDVNHLSGGQRQKVMIARALAQEASVLLLDEPTANLDIKHELEVLALIREQAAAGATVVITVHDLNLAARFCDSIIMLKKGRVHAVGGREVLTRATIRAVYGVDAHIVRDGKKRYIVPVAPAPMTTTIVKTTTPTTTTATQAGPAEGE